MRSNLKSMCFMPLPVCIIATYDKDNKPNAMNAAWATIYDYGKVTISLAKHKTTDNLEINKAFTLSFATKDTLKISDYFGIVSGNDEDKIERSKVNVIKSNFVNAPIITNYPLTLECIVESFIDGTLIGKVVNTTIDNDYLDKDGNIDIDKMELITFDMSSNTYRVLGKKVGKAFFEGKSIK